MKKLLMGCMAALAALISLVGCEQDRVVYGGPNYLMFSDTIYYCPVQETNEIFNVPVSATETADRDRTFAVEVIDKKSNAVEGKHYKILSNTVTIKAGETAANLEVECLREYRHQRFTGLCPAPHHSGKRPLGYVRYRDQSGVAQDLPVRHQRLHRTLQGDFLLFRRVYAGCGHAPDNLGSCRG